MSVQLCMLISTHLCVLCIWATSPSSWYMTALASTQGREGHYQYMNSGSVTGVLMVQIQSFRRSSFRCYAQISHLERARLKIYLIPSLRTHCKLSKNHNINVLDQRLNLWLFTDATASFCKYYRRCIVPVSFVTKYLLSLSEILIWTSWDFNFLWFVSSSSWTSLM